MKYKSLALTNAYYEIEIDLLNDFKEQLKLRLTKARVKTASGNPIYDFFNFQKRYIEPTPRVIKNQKSFLVLMVMRLLSKRLKIKFLQVIIWFRT